MAMEVKDRPRLGVPARFAITFGALLALSLVVAVGAVLHREGVERRKRAATRRVLESFAEDIREFGDPPQLSSGDLTDLPLPRAEISLPAHPRRKAGPLAGATIKFGEPNTRADGWGNLIRYRCPGPIHTHGWDVWSCGPNGIDEHGSGDDLLIGEDVAPVGTGP